MNRQFPCILKGFYTYFVFDKGSAIPLDENCIANIDEINFNDKVFKNITAEYLANTYGEVKSKEHAEFIVKLAEVNDLGVISSSFNFESDYFAFKRDGSLYFFDRESHALMLGRKQITIPLPPECESVDDGKKPLKVLSSGRVYTFNEVTEYYDYNISELGYVEGKTLETLKEADDYEVISFIDDDEWPKVNDDVFYNGQKWTFVAKHNDMAMLFWTGDEYCTAKISELQKPKTPEQELNDGLYELCLTHCDSKFQASEIARKLMEKYNITKKPQ